jgi:hypothetical protein
MAHRLEKHYSDFGGLDTRSNLLTQNPKSARLGSKNFRWNYNDELQQMEGIQHKTDQGSACEFGLIEYKFKDIDTGKAKSEILGVAADGKLRKRYSHKLKLTRTSISSAYYYSLLYDAPTTTHKIQFLDSLLASIGSVDISLTQTLDQLKTAINALALTGLTADIVDEDGTSVTSSLKAYLLDVTYQKQFVTSITDIVYNEVFDWTLINTPDGAAPFENIVKYVAKTAPFDDPKIHEDYEGISSTNLNNACYITDGGFPFKYDGFHVYRAGMPKTLAGGLSGTTVAYDPATFGPSGSTTGVRWISYQYVFKDPSGVTAFGKINGQGPYPIDSGIGGYEQIAINILDAAKSATFAIKRIAQESKFPIYSCAPSADTTISGTGLKVITVKSGHNIAPGMILRLTTRTTTIVGTVYYAEVTAVTATTVTVNCPTTLGGNFGSSPGMLANVCLNGFYGPSYLSGQTYTVDPFYVNFFSSDIWGPYIKIYSTIAGADMDTERYFYSIAGIPHDSSHEYTIQTSINDSILTVALDNEGEDLPRACKYLNAWQGQLVQAGRAVNPDLANDYYASLYSTPPTNVTEWARNNLYYSEAHLCDYQSIYWADTEESEGFPQSGANEESFENDFNDEITGIATNKESLFVYKTRTTAYLTGTLATGDLVKEFLEAEVGNACQAALQPVSGSIIFMDEDGGFYSVVAGRLPQFLGYPIQDFFKKNKIKLTDAKLNFKKAKSANFKAKNQYLCYIPAGNSVDPTSNSLILVYDYSETATGIRGCWYVWQDVNAAGGILATADGDLLLSHKETSNNRLWKQKFTGSKYDFSNHTSAIEFNYKGAFETLGAPVIDKSWIRCVINSVLGGFTLRVDQYANFIDSIVGSMNITFAASNRKTVKDEVRANSDKLSGLSWGFYHNTIHEAVTISGWEVEYSPSFDTGEAKR